MAVVVITGSNSGFGLQGASAFARNGDTVYATMRDVSKAGALQSAADVEGLSVRIKQLDVSKPNTFTSFVENVIGEAGRIDVLVNNAGVLRAGTVEDTSEDTLRMVMETNFFGAALLSQAVLPHMRSQGSGYIIMVSSLSGLAGLPGDFSYTASKFALEGATEAMRHEVDRWGIKVALVEAGMYATGIMSASVSGEALLPDYYPDGSPYRPLIESKLGGIRARRSEAFDPKVVGELFVEIANSDGSRLRWPADPVAEKVLGTMFGQDDAARDQFLRDVSGTAWWSEGREAPE
ncbi:MAG: SDR family oxidoreductase [Gammaproteobacteria bacterium]|nr:SDR family oxidoreductase [Gammaproteobacteria bacterium]